MSDFEQKHNDEARRDGYSSSKGENRGGRTPRPRFTRNTSAERASYGNRGNYDNGYPGRNDRPGRFSNNTSRRNDDSRNGGYGRPFGSRSTGDYERPSRTYSHPASGYTSESGSYGNTSRQGGYSRRNDYSSRPNRGYNEAGDRYSNSGGNGSFRHSGQAGYNRGGQGGGFRHPAARRFNPGKRRIDYKEEAYDPNQPIRLNKFLANAGVCSRRDADKYIQAGVVSVNGEIITELGHKVLRSDTVLFHDQQVKAEKKIYVLLNKPKGYVTTSEDPQNRKTVMDLVRNACMERIYPVGRLDRNTTGVLLLTNDGEMASKLTHPKFMKKKIYHVYLDRNVSAADMRQIAEGVMLEDGEIHADSIEYASETDRKQVGIEIHSGKNRIVRRIFSALGYNVIKLDRVYFAGLTKKNVKRGDWRYLTEEEVQMLRMGAFE